MKKIYIPILALLMIFGSCSEDKLYTLPEGIIIKEEFYADTANLKYAFDALYFVRFYDGFDIQWGDYGTDDALCGGENEDDQGEQSLQKQNYSYGASTSQNNTIWEGLYNLIANVNFLFLQFEDMEESPGKDLALGEAHFHRGFYYYTLAKLFGEVPLITEWHAELDSSLKPKSNYDEVCAFVEEELNTAALLLNSKSETKIGRANSGAAIGLNCKLASYRQEYDKVKKYADEIINSNEYSLDPDFRNIWLESGEHGSGSIMEMTYNAIPTTDWGHPGRGSMIATSIGIRPDHAEATGSLPGAPQIRFNGWGFHLMTKDLYDEFEDGDPRLGLTMYSVGDTNRSFYRPEIDRESDDTLNYPRNGMYNRKYSFYPWTDYGQPSYAPNGNNMGHNFRVIRLADIYLLRAEAAYHEGDEATARMYVNMVRERARNSTMISSEDYITPIENPVANPLPGITASGQDLLDAIYHERRVELAMEFERTWELIRTGRTDIIKALWPNFEDGKHYFMPIPTQQIDRSGGKLIQNPYW